MIVLVEEYLAYRRRLGYDLRGIDHQLRRFAQYADAIGYRGPVTVELAVRWARLPQQASPHWWQRRLGFVRGFAKFCSMSSTLVRRSPLRASLVRLALAALPTSTRLPRFALS